MKVLLCIAISVSMLCSGIHSETVEEQLSPTVTIAIMARNTAHSLPWFLGCIENLDYPKDRISVWIRTDHNEDDTVSMLSEWVNGVERLYHHVNLSIGSDGRYSNEKAQGLGIFHPDRYEHLAYWRQESLDAARHAWSDYYLSVDTDNFVYDRKLLQRLMAEERTLIAPHINSTSLYANFWGAISSEGYYKRSEDYMDIISARKQGVFEVPMIHSLFLLNLNDKKSRLLAYSPTHPQYTNERDDIMQFAFSARINGVPMHYTNKHYTGFLIAPIENSNILQIAPRLSLYIRLHHINNDMKLEASKHIKLKETPKTKLGFDQVYMINLVRRPERREMMEKALEELAIDYQYVAAVDGKQLNTSYLESLGVKQLEGYLDPYHQRPMKMGEIGCFLSHYFIWKEMEEKGFDRILIFEDDVRFKLNFVRDFHSMMAEADRHYGGWDILYLGRKIMTKDEEFVPNSDHLVYPGYTYWTLSYALTTTGLHKLLAQNPLQRMLPVDEFLPIMFDAHDRPEWKEKFSPRDLIALSANPLHVEPLKYIGEVGYVSDTEDSTPLAESKQEASSVQEAEAEGMSTSDNIERHQTLRGPTVSRVTDEL